MEAFAKGLKEATAKSSFVSKASDLPMSEISSALIYRKGNKVHCSFAAIATNMAHRTSVAATRAMWRQRQPEEQR